MRKFQQFHVLFFWEYTARKVWKHWESNMRAMNTGSDNFVTNVTYVIMVTMLLRISEIKALIDLIGVFVFYA